ncbi:mib1 [Symbiodinium sp. CCMP2592]|nr:mib1 [Symbiodinium sp. CCMP2592]
MEEWKLDRKNIRAGSFKWHADEYYARGDNKPKHMYSPDWLDVEMKTHHEKARGGTATIKVNPLEGPSSPKPSYGFFEPDASLRPKSPIAMDLGWQTLSGTQPLANTLNKRRPASAMTLTSGQAENIPHGEHVSVMAADVRSRTSTVCVAWDALLRIRCMTADLLCIAHGISTCCLGMAAAGVQLPQTLQGEAQMQQLDTEIGRLSQEWRQQRDSFRARTSMVSPDEQLVAAAANGRIQECRQLLQRGAAGPEATSKVGQSALMAAARAGSAEAVSLLLAARADPSSARGERRTTALHSATELGHGKICLALLSARADPEQADARGTTPALMASDKEALWPLFAAVGCERAPPQSSLSSTTSPELLGGGGCSGLLLQSAEHHAGALV